MLNRLTMQTLKRSKNCFSTSQVNSRFSSLQQLLKSQKADLDSEFSQYHQELNESRKAQTQSYTHPLDHENNPVNLCYIKDLETFFDLVGPEQVSPHYENFLHSRKVFFGFTGLFLLMSHGMVTRDLSWIL